MRLEFIITPLKLKRITGMYYVSLQDKLKDNAASNTSEVAKVNIYEWRFELVAYVAYPPNSLDMVMSDFFYFLLS